MSFYLHGSVVAAACCVGPVLAFANAQPVPGDIMLVVVPPWRDSLHIVADSNGRPIGPMTSAFGTLALSDDPDFADYLRSNGAWFVVDGKSIASICGIET